ncbi:MAG: hypothetical protein RL013_2682 [Bacteroidota bacterium]|jgi:hypothetical protein
MKMTSYFNPGLAISVMVPEDWTISQVSETKFRLFGLPESGLEEYFDEYRATMSYEIIASPIGQLSEWFNDMISGNNSLMSREYYQYSLISEQYYESGTHPAYRKVYTWTDEETDLRLYQLQAFIYGGQNTLYLINAAVVDTFKDRYLPVFESILESTRIIPSI